MRENTNILKARPTKIWEFREYPKGSLLESGIVLNGTATFIYKLCNGDKKVSEIIKMISENYKVNPEKAKIDTINCIKELFNANAIKLK